MLLLLFVSQNLYDATPPRSYYPPYAPLTQLPSVTVSRINWTPATTITIPLHGVLHTTAPSAEMGILDSEGQPVEGSGGPPYGEGNIPVGTDQVATNVILVPDSDS